MYQWLEEVKTKLKEIVHSLFDKISNLRVAFIAHGDYCDAQTTYVIKHIPFSRDANALIKWIQNAEQTGGGDWPECYEYVLYTAARFKWSPYANNKALVIIGDATPHFVDFAQNTLNIDWREELERICMKGIKIYGIHCGGNSKSKYFYDTISRRSGGIYLTLGNMKNICDIFIALCLRSSDKDKFETFTNQLITAKNADKELQNALKELNATESNASAVKRLMRDLKEIQRERLSNIAVVPDNNDVFKWHINIQPLQGALHNVYIHLILHFPAQYPSRPPDIKVHSYFMNDIHPNIMDNAICINVLRSNIGIDGSSGCKYGGWTAAYSITSLLVNIASLFCDIKYLKQKEMDGLIKRIRETDCECGHSHHTPYPPLLSCIAPIDIVYEAYDTDDTMVAVTIAGTIIQTKIEDEYCKIKSMFPIQRHHKCVSWSFVLDWFDIKSAFIMGYQDKTSNFFGINHNGYRVYRNTMDNNAVYTKTLKQNDTITYILYLSCNIIIILINNEYVADIIMSSDYNKTMQFYPTMFVKNIRLKLLFEANHELSAFPSKLNLSINEVNVISELPEITGFAPTETRQFYQTQNEWNMLLFKTLSSDVLLIIYSFLLYSDISRCKHINTHWYLTIISHLVLERISSNCYFTGDSWRDDILGVGLYVEYNGESNWIKTAKTEMDLLSLTAWNEYGVRCGAWSEPLTHFLPLVINEKHSEKSKAELVDRIAMLCKAESFTEEIALIGISALMNQFVVQLMGDVDDDKIDIKHASEKALIGYCAFHHLLLYLSNEFPLMRVIAYKNVNDFMQNYTKRCKAQTPDLGKFLINLTIINDEEYDGVNWKHIGKAFIDESLDRSVKWYLQKKPGLENMTVGDGDNDTLMSNDGSTVFSDKKRLQTVFNATQTGRRLILFQHWFIEHIARPKDKTLKQILNDYNKKWGKPTDKQKKYLMQCVNDILKNKTNYKYYNWLHYFNDLGVGHYECFSRNEQIVKVLKENVIRSALKGYHRKNKVLSRNRKYKDIARSIYFIEFKRRMLLTDRPSIGPMARLKYMMDAQKDVMLIMRMTERQCKKVVGRIKTFDRHWNIIMINAKEYWRSQICYCKHNPIFVDKDRSLGRYVFVRGDDIIAIRILDGKIDDESDAKDLIEVD